MQQKNVALFIGQVLQCNLKAPPRQAALSLDVGLFTRIWLAVCVYISGMAVAFVTPNVVDKTVVRDVV
jgi:hypothetical protein